MSINNTLCKPVQTRFAMDKDTEISAHVQDFHSAAFVAVAQRSVAASPTRNMSIS